MPRHDELTVLLRSARQLAKLCRDAAALVSEARDHEVPPEVMAGVRKVHSDLLRSKHALEDEIVAFVLDARSVVAVSATMRDIVGLLGREGW